MKLTIFIYIVLLDEISILIPNGKSLIQHEHYFKKLYDYKKTPYNKKKVYIMKQLIFILISIQFFVGCSSKNYTPIHIPLKITIESNNKYSEYMKKILIKSGFYLLENSDTKISFEEKGSFYSFETYERKSNNKSYPCFYSNSNYQANMVVKQKNKVVINKEYLDNYNKEVCEFKYNYYNPKEQFRSKGYLKELFRSNSANSFIKHLL